MATPCWQAEGKEQGAMVTDAAQEPELAWQGRLWALAPVHYRDSETEEI